MKPFRDWCHDRWVERYDRKPEWSGFEYGVLAKLGKRDDTESVRTAWANYLADADSFYAGHTPRKFQQNLDRWLPATTRRREQLTDVPVNDFVSVKRYSAIGLRTKELVNDGMPYEQARAQAIAETATCPAP